jgi:alpha-1,3-mannosyltransferase
MKILAITPTFFPQLGGMEIMVFELASCMRDLGIVMDIAHVSVNYKTLSEETMQGIKVIRVPLYGNRLIGLAPALMSLAKHYDLLHVHDPQILAITSNVKLLCAHKPAILSTHGGFHHTKQYALFKKIYEKTFLRLLLGNYNRVLASSVGDEDYFRNYSENVELCSNGVNIEKFNCVNKWKGKSTSQWIYWGRLSKNKRVDLIIDYVAKAKALGFFIDLMICGRDFDNVLDELKNKVTDLGLEVQIKFEEFLDDNLLLNELNERGVFITATEHEGFGLSLVEAMAAGLIVVCRNMIPLNSFIKSGESGFFLDFDGAETDLIILNKLLALNEPEAEFISNNARVTSGIYDWKNASQQFLRHYREVLQDSKNS